MNDQCDFCNEVNKTQKIHCNSCVDNHEICSTCLVNYKSEMGIKPVRKHTLYESNLKKWAWVLFLQIMMYTRKNFL